MVRSPLKTSKEDYLQKFDSFLNNSGIPYEKELLKNHTKRVLSILNGEDFPPYELEIQPSSRCNAGCLHCFGKNFEKCSERLYEGKNMDIVIEQVLNFKKNGFEVDVVKFCGSTGEPLLNPQTIYAIGRLYKERSVRLFTNGILLGANKKNYEYLNSISKINRLDLSLDAGTTDILWKIKPGAKARKVSLEDILEAVKRIRNISESREDKIRIEVGYVISNWNYMDIIEAVKKAKESCADMIRFRVDFVDRSVSKNHGDRISSILKEAKTYEDKYFEVIPAHSERQIKSADSSCFSSRDCGFRCFVCKLWACIGPDGGMYPCGHVANNIFESYRNVLEKNISEIWESQQRKNLINKLPDKNCDICSPSSFRTNNFLTFLSDIPIEESGRLINRFNKDN